MVELQISKQSVKVKKNKLCTENAHNIYQVAHRCLVVFLPIFDADDGSRTGIAYYKHIAVGKIAETLHDIRHDVCKWMIPILKEQSQKKDEDEELQEPATKKSKTRTKNVEKQDGDQQAKHSHGWKKILCLSRLQNDNDTFNFKHGLVERLIYTMDKLESDKSINFGKWRNLYELRSGETQMRSCLRSLKHFRQFAVGEVVKTMFASNSDNQGTAVKESISAMMQNENFDIQNDSEIRPELPYQLGIQQSQQVSLTTIVLGRAAQLPHPDNYAWKTLEKEGARKPHATHAGGPEYNHMETIFAHQHFSQWFSSATARSQQMGMGDDYRDNIQKIERLITHIPLNEQNQRFYLSTEGCKRWALVMGTQHAVQNGVVEFTIADVNQEAIFYLKDSDIPIEQNKLIEELIPPDDFFNTLSIAPPAYNTPSGAPTSSSSSSSGTSSLSASVVALASSMEESARMAYNAKIENPIFFQENFSDVYLETIEYALSQILCCNDVDLHSTMHTYHTNHALEVSIVLVSQLLPVRYNRTLEQVQDGYPEISNQIYKLLMMKRIKRKKKILLELKKAFWDPIHDWHYRMFHAFKVAALDNETYESALAQWKEDNLESQNSFSSSDHPVVNILLNLVRMLDDMGTYDEDEEAREIQQEQEQQQQQQQQQHAAAH